ncbi:MAG: FIG01964566: Predicted membrane protein, hemolysin III homolog, partial [uncultured Nocardioidaceae bacterium]
GGADRRRARRGQAPAARLAARRHLAPGPGRRDRAGRALPDHDGADRQHRLHRDRPAALHGLGGLPPRDLEPPRVGVPAALRPRQHLPAHRRQLHAVHPADGGGARTGGAVERRVGRGTGRDGLPVALDRRAALALRADLHRAGLGSGVLHRRLRQRRRTRGRGVDRRRGPALHARWRRLRVPAPQPLPVVVRVPRGLPLADDLGVHHPLRGGLARHLLAAL